MVASAPSGHAAVIDRNVDAFLAKRDGDGLSHPGAATGDDGTLADQSLQDVLLCCQHGGAGNIVHRYSGRVHGEMG